MCSWQDLQGSIFCFLWPLLECLMAAYIYVGLSFFLYLISFPLRRYLCRSSYLLNRIKLIWSTSYLRLSMYGSNNFRESKSNENSSKAQLCNQNFRTNIATFLMFQNQSYHFSHFLRVTCCAPTSAIMTKNKIQNERKNLHACKHNNSTSRINK